MHACWAAELTKKEVWAVFCARSKSRATAWTSTHFVEKCKTTNLQSKCSKSPLKSKIEKSILEKQEKNKLRFVFLLNFENNEKCEFGFAFFTFLKKTNLNLHFSYIYFTFCFFAFLIFFTFNLHFFTFLKNKLSVAFFYIFKKPQLFNRFFWLFCFLVFLLFPPCLTIKSNFSTAVSTMQHPFIGPQVVPAFKAAMVKCDRHSPPKNQRTNLNLEICVFPCGACFFHSFSVCWNRFLKTHFSKSKNLFCIFSESEDTIHIFNYILFTFFNIF